MEDNQKKYGNIFGIALLLVAVFALGVFTGRNVNEKDPKALFNIASSSKKADLSMFWNVWDTVQKNFVDKEKLDEKDMIYGAIKGMVNSIDDVGTAYLDPKETEEFNSAREGKYFEGIGAELGYESGQVIIVSPIEGSPAKAGGIRSGDYILKIDGYVLTTSDSVYDAVAKIRGEAGTEVTLTVLHKGERVPVDITLKRSQITVPSMTVEFIGNNKDIAYLKLSRFTDNTLQSWESEWDESVRKINNAKVKKVILDLRGNPGGFFDAAVYAGDDFLDKGFIISQQRNAEGKIEKFESKGGGNLLNSKVVVLIDRGSASASEILAGALQQAGRAKVVGETTYGKGTAQRIYDFGDGSSLHLTIVKWLLPDGQNIDNGNSINPDIEIKYSNEDFQKGIDPQLNKAMEEINK